jgi:hypothetical protein
MGIFHIMPTQPGLRCTFQYTREGRTTISITKQPKDPEIRSFDSGFVEGLSSAK